MGHDYKITAAFSQKNIDDIETLLVEQLQFTKRRSDVSQKEIFELRDEHIAPNAMPYCHIEFDDDGLYVLNNLHSYLWTHIELLRIFLSKENIIFNIIDYSE